MHFRVPARSFALVAAVVVGVAGVIPALTVHARGEQAPPFEIVFPQETYPTAFSDTYGHSRSGGRSHKGTDLLAPRMTEIYAIADGVVIFVGINNLSGRNVKVDHGDGWESYYLHMNNDNPGSDDGRASWDLTVAPGIVEGSTVSAGQLIGWVGDSGNAEGTTPHTHFELRRNGQSLNAYSLLVDAYERAIESEEEARLALLDQEIE